MLFPKSENANSDLLRSGVHATNPEIIVELPVRIELKREKYEARLLVLTQYRLFLLKPSAPVKVESSHNILDICHIESCSPHSLKLTLLGIESKPLVFVCDSSINFDSFLAAFVYAFRLSFPETSRKSLPPIATSPPSRCARITTAFGCVSAPNAAASFSSAYRCWCDRLSGEYKPFVAWDVDTILWMHDDRELALSDFEQGPVDSLQGAKDYIPLMAALRFDTWFTRLNLSHLKLSVEIIAELCHVLASNRSLTEICLASISGRPMHEVLSKVQQAVSTAPCNVSMLDLSGNSFDDKAIASLCGIMNSLSLSQLSLAKCQLAKQQLCQVADCPGLRSAAIAGQLTHLDVSSSACKSDETSSALCNLVSNACSLKHLNVAATDVNLQHLGNALLIGCINSLQSLDASQNSAAFRHVASASACISCHLVKFLRASSSLKRLCLGENRLSAEFIRHSLAALAANSQMGEQLDLDLACNELQKAHGATQALYEWLPRCACLVALNLADNGLDGTEFARVIEAASRCSSLDKFTIARNVPSTKTRLHVADSLALMLQQPSATMTAGSDGATGNSNNNNSSSSSSSASTASRLRALDVSDCRLRNATSTLCAALTDAAIVELDISGNLMGDSGLVYLSKALQGNTRLRRVAYDRNQCSVNSLQALASALGKNSTLVSMPTPLLDVATLLNQKASVAERCSQACAKIEATLARNRELDTTLASNNSNSNSTSSTVPRQVFRFQIGCAISENIEALWQMYAEIQHSLLVSPMAAGVEVDDLAAVEEERIEIGRKLGKIRDTLCKLSSMSFSEDDLVSLSNSSSSRNSSGASLTGAEMPLAHFATLAVEPSLERLRRVVAMLDCDDDDDDVQHSLLSSYSTLESQREAARAFSTSIQSNHYSALFRLLEAVTLNVRTRLRECRFALQHAGSSNATSSKRTPTKSFNSSSKQQQHHRQHQQFKYGTINRRQRPVSQVKPDTFALSGATAEDEQKNVSSIDENVLYLGNSDSSTMYVDNRICLDNGDDIIESRLLLVDGEGVDGALLSNQACKGRPRKPKNQKPTRPVVDVGHQPPPSSSSSSSVVAASVQHRSRSGSSGQGRRSRSHHSAVEDENGSRDAQPINRKSETSAAAAGDAVMQRIVGGIRVGPSVNLGELKLRKAPSSNTMTAEKSEASEDGGDYVAEQCVDSRIQPHLHGSSGTKAMANFSANNGDDGDTSVHNIQPSVLLKRLSRQEPAVDGSSSSNNSNGGDSKVSVLRPKPPAKPAKPPKSAVVAGGVGTSASLPKSVASALQQQFADGGQGLEEQRPSSPPGFAESGATAFADRMSRFGGSVAKTRRDQNSRSMMLSSDSSNKSESSAS